MVISQVSIPAEPEKAAKYGKVETDFGFLPVGGTTGICHESSAAIDEAAQWYAANRQACQRPVIPVLKRMFGLSALEAVSAIRTADGVQQWALVARAFR